VGAIGHTSHKQVSAVGDTVNVASRIEAMNRELGTTVLVSEDVVRQVPPTIRRGWHAAVTLRGRSERSTLVEVLGVAEPEPLPRSPPGSLRVP
jgi:adenylate cyclase